MPNPDTVALTIVSNSTTTAPAAPHHHQASADGLAYPVPNTANTPIETIEADHPPMVERHALVPDTVGPGHP